MNVRPKGEELMIIDVRAGTSRGQYLSRIQSLANHTASTGSLRIARAYHPAPHACLLRRYAHCRLERLLVCDASGTRALQASCENQYRLPMVYSFPSFHPPHAELQPEAPKSMRGAHYRAHIVEWRRGEFSYHVHLLPVH
jgi:hypothetical protein